MPTDNLSPRRQRLAAALKALRLATGVSGNKMAADLGWSQSKLSRAERGLTFPPLVEFRRWLDYCGATDDQRDELLALADEVQVEVATTRQLNRSGHAFQQRTRIDHDADATHICIYQPEVVPGLLQTANYARLLLLAIGAATAETVAESVTARLERQLILHDEDKTIDAVITQTALAWQPGSATVSREQLHHLLALAELPTVNLGIVSREQQKHVLPANSFVLTRWSDSTDVVTESLTAEVVITDPRDVAEYEQMFELQRSHAAYGEDAAALIRHVLNDLD